MLLLFHLTVYHGLIMACPCTQSTMDTWFPNLTIWSRACSYGKAEFLAENARYIEVPMCLPLETSCPYDILEDETLKYLQVNGWHQDTYDHLVLLVPDKYHCVWAGLGDFLPGKTSWLASR